MKLLSALPFITAMAGACFGYLAGGFRHSGTPGLEAAPSVTPAQLRGEPGTQLTVAGMRWDPATDQWAEF